MCIVYVLVNVLCVALASINVQIIILFAITECIVTYCILCCYAMALSAGKDNCSDDGVLLIKPQVPSKKGRYLLQIIRKERELQLNPRSFFLMSCKCVHSLISIKSYVSQSLKLIVQDFCPDYFLDKEKRAEFTTNKWTHFLLLTF